MSELQVRKDDLATTRIVDAQATEEQSTPGANEILVRVERFAFTTNNITYAVTGDQLGYWQFFPPAGDDTEGWGLIPVWGFANVVASNVDGIPVGERLFGYFPPADFLRLEPVHIAADRILDGAAHRSKLPAGYNTYRRVAAEPAYDRAYDAERMLFWPLHVTSYCLWDALMDAGWYGAQQVIVISASSKTSIGLAYGLDMDDSSPACVAVTSKPNLEFVEQLGLYDQAVTYDDVTGIDAGKPAVLVDMSGNDRALNALNDHLGDNMKFCLRVGITNRDEVGRGAQLERSAFFFAPSHIEKRIKDWGADTFMRKSATFVQTTSARSRDWLTVTELDGLAGLRSRFDDIANGRIAANEGLIVKLQS